MLVVAAIVVTPVVLAAAAFRWGSGPGRPDPGAFRR